ncbi:MAG: MAPEG family protein [Xanthomonadales bacterium]|nr:MAPEG family protein [Xanthomonadales bacterium]
MYYEPLLIPLLLQAGLILLVWLAMYATRLTEMKRKGIDPQDLVNTETKNELLKNVAAASDNFKNQFELPTLFFIAILTALILVIHSPLLNSLAMAFVLLRMVHSFVHITYNKIMHRFAAYALSSFALIGMWVVIAANVITR